MPEIIKQLQTPLCIPGTSTPILTVTVDLQTTGLDPWRDKIVLIAYRFNSSGPIRVIQYGQAGTQEQTRFLSRILSSGITVRGHNVKFDALFLAVNGFNIAGPLDDTRILAYLNCPQEQHGLKYLTMNKLNRDVVTMDDIGIKTRKKTLLTAFRQSPKYVQIAGRFFHKKKLIQYNKADVKNTDDLKAYFPSSQWYRQVQVPVLKVLFLAQQRGLKLDRLHLHKLNFEYSNRIADIDGRYPGINLNSSAQVASIFAKKGLKIPRTPKGNYKMDKDVLKTLAWGGDKDAQTILDRRGLVKLKTTYLQPFIQKCDFQGIIHGSFNQAGRESFDQSDSQGTATGRLTSSNPNLQQIPGRTQQGRKIRQAFVPRQGFKMVNADLKQIQPRILAHFSQSPVLIKAYKQGLDTHALFGSLIYNKPMSALAPMQRFIGKTSWLASVYGATPQKLKLIAQRNSQVPLDFDQGYYQGVQDRFWKANPQLASWRRQHIERTRRDGYIRTLGGRIIKIKNMNARPHFLRLAAERTAVNYLIQGSAADCMKLILVKYYEDIVKTGVGHLLATVHDEILGQIDAKMANQEMLKKVKSIMCDTVRLNNVPIDTDAKYIASWADK